MQRTFQAEVITPLVVAGADARSANVVSEGLRPPTVRGTLRYWFRTMTGGSVGDDLKVLQTMEGRVFGDTNQRSKIRVVTAPLGAFAPQPAFLRMNDQGALTLPSGRTVTAPSRRSIPPGTLYSLRLIGVDQPVLDLGLGALWLVLMLSGFGARTLRGFGSLAVTAGDAETARASEALNLSFNHEGADLKSIAAALATGLSAVKALFQRSVVIGSVSPASSYRAISTSTARLYLIRPKVKFWGSWQEAMNGLRDDLYRALKGALKRSSIGSASPRRPSPLIIQIKRSAAGGYFGVLLAFQDDEYFGSAWAALQAFLKGLSGYEVEDIPLP